MIIRSRPKLAIFQVAKINVLPKAYPLGGRLALVWSVCRQA